MMASLLGAMALAAIVLATVPAPDTVPLAASEPDTEGVGAFRSEREEDAGEDQAVSGKGAGSSLLRICRTSMTLACRLVMRAGCDCS